MPGDSVALDQFDKVPGLVEGQRRLGKVFVFRKEIPRSAVEICEIAPPAAGDEDFAPGLGVVVQQRHPAAALPGHGGAHQPRRAGPQNNHIELAGRCGHELNPA